MSHEADADADNAESVPSKPAWPSVDIPSVEAMAAVDNGSMAERSVPRDTRDQVVFDGNVPLAVEYDLIVPLLSQIHNSVQFLISVSPSITHRVSNVGLKLECRDVFALSGAALRAQLRKGDVEEIPMQLPPLTPGVYACRLTAKAYFGGLTHEYVGRVSLVVHDRKEALREAAQNISYTYNPSVSFGGIKVSRDRISNPREALPDDFFAKMGGKQPDPLEEVARMAAAGIHRYRQIPLSAVAEPPPRNAVTGELSLTYHAADANFTIQIFSDDIIQIGQSDGVHRYTDIVYGRPVGVSESPTDAYAKISRKHCQIAWEDERVTLVDGGVYARDSSELRPSTNGTFFDGHPLTEKRTLSEGEIGIGPVSGGLSLKIRMLRPSVCGDCCMPESERRHCCEGKRPCVLLKRSDVAALSYVILWSCLDLGCVDTRMKGLTIRRERGAFALQQNGESQWLADGMKISLSETSTLAISHIWNQ